jgi:hypothetical protein
MDPLRPELGSSPAADGASVSELDAGRARHMLLASRDMFADLGAPSPLGTVLFSGFVSEMAISPGDGTWGVAAGFSLMGYACRMVEPGAELPPAVASSIAAEITLTEDGEVDYDEICDAPDRLDCLIRWVSTLSDESPAIGGLTACTSGAWEAFAGMANHELRRNFLRHGLPTCAIPPDDVCEKLLRVGYVVRVIDEVAGERPAGRRPRAPDGRGRTTAGAHGGSGLSEGTPIPVETWLPEAAAVCVEDFTGCAERLLDRAPPAVFVVAPIDSSPGSDMATLAVAAARFGYALRNRECALIEGARQQGDDACLAVELDRRARGTRCSDEEVVDLLTDVIRYGYCGGAAALLELVPGTANHARVAALEAAAERFNGGLAEDGDYPALALIHYGYLLHRVLELQPQPRARQVIASPDGGQERRVARRAGEHDGSD